MFHRLFKYIKNLQPPSATLNERPGPICPWRTCTTRCPTPTRSSWCAWRAGTSCRRWNAPWRTLKSCPTTRTASSCKCRACRSSTTLANPTTSELQRFWWGFCNFDMQQSMVTLSAFQVKCAACAWPAFEPLQPETEYNVVVMSFLKKGGDGYSAISKNLLFADGLETLDIDVLVDYISSHSPLILGLEQRIKFRSANDSSLACGGAETHGAKADILLMMALTIVAPVLVPLFFWQFVDFCLTDVSVVWCRFYYINTYVCFCDALYTLRVTIIMLI